jgi:K+/H+ antiporter YhaU regulatory subunit KhtT
MEQAADSLAYAMDFLPEQIDWPVSFLEVRLRSDASAAGESIRDLPVSATGASVLAVSRGGRIVYEPEADFTLYPGDRLLLMGPPGALKDAEEVLNHLNPDAETRTSDRFEIAEIEVGENSPLSGKTLAQINFRHRFGATLVGIRRGEEKLTSVGAEEYLYSKDCIIVIGKESAIKKLQEMAPL